MSELSRIQGEVYGCFDDYAMQRVTTPFSLLWYHTHACEFARTDHPASISIIYVCG
jgi:hypothetical protein